MIMYTFTGTIDRLKFALYLNFSFPLIAFVSEFLLTIIIINYSTKEKPDGSKNIIKHKHFLSKLNHHAETPKISQLKGQINQNFDNSALAIFKNASLFFFKRLDTKRNHYKANLDQNFPS